MKGYIVVQSAAYRHDIGPFALTLEEAIRLGCERAKLEKDSHHEFEVLEVSDSLEDGRLVATITNVFEQVTRMTGIRRDIPREYDTGLPAQKVTMKIGAEE